MNLIRGLITPFIVIIIALIVGLGVYSLIQKQQAPSPVADTTSVTWKKYTSPRYGFSFYYPNSWTVKEMGETVEVDPNPDDRISLTVQNGSQAHVEDAKFGPTTLWYDASTSSWNETTSNDREGGPSTLPVQPTRSTVGGYPVFNSTGRWKTDIIAVSPTKFIIANITGSGFTAPLDPLVMTITPSGFALTNAQLAPLVDDQMRNAKPNF